MKFGFTFLVSIAFASSLSARLGETPLQFANRYGAPANDAGTKAMEKNFPLIDGAIHHTYEYQGWNIRAAFLNENGPAVRMEYSKILKAGVGPTIQDFELQAIMTANVGASGYAWKQIAYNNPDSPNKGLAKALESVFLASEKMWQRTDGVLLWLRSNLTARLELPAAREYEAKLKADKENKARAAVPKF